MSLAAFSDAVESSSLQVLIRHWADARRERLMPGWNDIRPAAIRAQLPIIWSWKFDRSANEFIGRLAGERIQDVFRTSLRGAKMSDIFSGHEYQRMFERHSRVATTPELFRGHGLVFRHMDRFDIGERIILPLADDGWTGDGIIGATDFRSNFGALPNEIAISGEVEEWFSPD